MKKYLPDTLLIVGFASVSFGSWLIYMPAGYLVAGVLAIVAGLKLASL